MVTRFFRRLSVGIAFCSVLAGFGVLSYKIYHRENPEAFLASKLVDEKNQVAQAFSPDDDLRPLLVSLIDVERKKLAVAIYTLTDKEIAYALKRAHDRGVSVEVVVDRGYGSDRYSKIEILANAGIPVWMYQSSEDERNASLMHNKFCIFSDNVDHKALVWTGSFNFTIRAHERNQENVVILDHPRIVEKFTKQFEVLKKRSVLITPSV